MIYFYTCSIYCFMFSRSLCNLMILNFEILQNGILYLWLFWDLEVLQNIQKTCESVIFSSFAHWRTATCTAHMWLIFRFCNETIHTESESTPHFLIFNAHKSFIDIILYPLLKNFCFKFIFLDLSRSNNENNAKYLLQLI